MDTRKTVMLCKKEKPVLIQGGTGMGFFVTYT